MRIGDWIGLTVDRFRKGKLHFGHGAIDALAEVSWVAAKACRLSPSELTNHLARRITIAEKDWANRIAEMRLRTRLPLAYLLHEAWLGKYRFYVDQRVIVPRSLLAEPIACGLSPWIRCRKSTMRGLDLCTGSGCLAILMAKSFPAMRVDAVDISADALDVAARNRSRYRLHKRVNIFQSDLYSGISRGTRYDIIVSNPPYVRDLSMKALPTEFRHEPELALAGGPDGLDPIRRIVPEAAKYLKRNGVLLLEIGHNKRAFEREFPRLPLVWLENSGGRDMVALIEAGHLRNAFK